MFWDSGNLSILFTWLIKRQSCHHIETSQLTCSANQLTGFYMMTTLGFNELIWIRHFDSSFCSISPKNFEQEQPWLPLSKKKTKKLNKQKRFKPFRTFLHRPLPKELFFGRKFMLTWSVIWIHRNWYTFHVCNTFSKQLHAAFILSSFLWLSLISAHISITNSRKLLSILLLWCQTRRLRFWLVSI